MNTNVSKKIVSMALGSAILIASTVVGASNINEELVKEDHIITDGEVTIQRKDTGGLFVQEVEGRRIAKEIISSDWSQEYIKDAHALGLLKRTNLEKYADFREDIDRNDFLDIVMNYVRLNVTQYKLDLMKVKYPKFIDTDNPNIIEAADLGIVKGERNPQNNKMSFSPNRNITREEIAVILHNAEEVIRGEQSKANSTVELRVFKDRRDISWWARKGVATVSEMGAIQGREDGTFAPKNPAKREEAVKIVVEMLNRRNQYK